MSLEIGTHVNSTDPLDQARLRDVPIVQVTLSDPKTWTKPVVSEAMQQLAHSDVGVFVHSPYVINVASTNNRVRIPSRKLLQQTIDVATEIGARGVVVHGGHLREADDPAVGPQNWFKAIDGLTITTPVLIENTAGGNHAQARTLEAIEATWQAISQSDNAAEVGFCLDTCHAFAAGLDMTTLVSDIMAITGRIDLVHLNDSQGAAGSGVDRHANLGEGEIEPDHLIDIVTAAAAPVILETPGDLDAHLRDLSWLAERGLIA